MSWPTTYAVLACHAGALDSLSTTIPVMNPDSMTAFHVVVLEALEAETRGPRLVQRLPLEQVLSVVRPPVAVAHAGAAAPDVHEAVVCSMLPLSSRIFELAAYIWLA